MKARKRDVSEVSATSVRTVKNGKTEYKSSASVSDSAGRSVREVSNSDGKATTAYARKRKPTAPVKVGPSRPGTTMANFNPGRSYSEIEKEVRPGISDAQSVADLERVKRMIR